MHLTLKRDTALCLLIGVCGGMASGLLGVGGGIVMVPMLVGLLRVSQHQAHGTSLGIISVVAIAGLVPYLARGDWDWVVLAELAAGAAVGVSLGTRVMVGLSAALLRALFALLLIAVAIRLIVFGS